MPIEPDSNVWSLLMTIGSLPFDRSAKPMASRSWYKSFRHKLLLAAVLVAPTPLMALGEGPWRIVLAQQLLAEKTCGLLDVLLLDEFRRDGEAVLEGKVSCVDGRSFDFVRRREHQKFELKLCEPAVC